jgi:extradiol dioxygenase family protein
MAVLYSPIKLKKNDIYIIEPYDGDIRLRAEEMKQMSATQVHSALVFFYHFGSVLLTTLQLSLIEVLQEMKTQLQVNPIQKSGGGSE